MKTLGLIALSLALGTASLARADAPVTPMTLGSVDAVLAFCGQVNPAGASAYKALKESLLGKDDHAREAATQTPAYRDGFAQISRVLKSAPRDWAVRACNDLLPRPGQQTTPPPAPMPPHAPAGKDSPKMLCPRGCYSPGPKKNPIQTKVRGS